MAGDHDLSHFAEKSGVVMWRTPWGCWWQSVHEVHIEVDLPAHTRAKQISVNVMTKEMECIIENKVLFKGKVPGPLHAEETVWTVEDGRLLTIVLSKADFSIRDEMWSSLLVDDSATQPDPLTLHEMRKKLDLERFQIENPGMDFSNAKLSKNYDRPPGWSTQRLAEESKSQQ